MLAMTDYSVSPISSLPPPKYLGHVEVEESRGMHVCEDAVKKLKAVSEGLAPESGHKQSESADPDQALCSLPPSQMGRKSVKSVLWVSADGLRVVDDKTKVGGLCGWRKASHPPPTTGYSSQGGPLDSAMCAHTSLAGCTVLIQE